MAIDRWVEISLTEHDRRVLLARYGDGKVLQATTLVRKAVQEIVGWEVERAAEWESHDRSNP
jgi:hypothetical protein